MRILRWFDGWAPALWLMLAIAPVGLAAADLDAARVDAETASNPRR